MTEDEMQWQRRLQELETWRRAVEMWRGAVDSQVDLFRAELRSNSQTTREAREEAKEGKLIAQSVKGDTAELVRLFQAAKVNLAILKGIGWVLGVVATAIGGFAAWKHWP